MVLLQFCPAPGRRPGVSELYASMLMVGATLTLGGVVVSAAMVSVGQANGSASLGSSLREESAGVQLSLVYAAVASSGACPAYRGVNEGTSLTLSVFDYGTVGFTPSEIMINSTAYDGPYSALAPGTMGRYSLSLGGCAHSSGITVLLVDAQGDEVQLGS